ncbi:amidase signature enzyme [Atractiella rhizophila]|nr:amidase signature enzyme [Atractiella rhizophila]
MSALIPSVRLHLAQTVLDPPLPTVAPADDLPYLSASIVEIVENIKTGKPGWTAQRVLEAFIRSSRRAHERTNCLTGTLYPEALAAAKALDTAYPPGSGRVKGLLHGVPISIKDHLGIAGGEGTIGITSYIGKKFERDALIVKVLKEQGAVVYVKTNVPQTMLAFECSNPIFGATTNPYNGDHTSGGSSGGEASLLAQDGSAAGIGSDVGGSLRIPAHYCGVYSLKPSKGRFPQSSYSNTPGAAGFNSVNSVLGPMARSVDDLEVLTKVVVEAMDQMDGGRERKIAGDTFIAIPWRNTEERKYRFGYWKEDGFVKASPACQRAVGMTVDALRQKGYECIEGLSFILVFRAMEIFAVYTSADRYNTLTKPLKNDKRERSMFLPLLSARLPWLLKVMVSWLFRYALGDHIMATLLRSGGHKDTEAIMRWNVKKADFTLEIREKWFQELNLDFIICPTQATPAMAHGKTWNLSPLAAATIFFNILDFTVGCLPVTRVSSSLDALPSTWKEDLKGRGAPILHDALYNQKAYDAKQMEGLPVGIQIAGSNWEEEDVLKAMKIVDEALGKRDFGRGQWTAQVAKEAS